MTKSWDAVRDEICRLYNEGRSLEYIRGHLLRERQFEASTRAFRLRLKAWKVKRSDSACSCSGHVAHGNESDGSGESSHRQRQSRDAVPPQDIAGGKIRGDSSQSPPARSGRLKSLSSIFQKLRQAQNLGDQAAMGAALRSCEFAEHFPTILHYAIKEPPSSGRHTVIRKVLTHMGRSGLSVDCVDDENQTALELAIRSNQQAVVGMLLEAGASAQRQDDHGPQPLHLALLSKASAAICTLLLSHGASPNCALTTRTVPTVPLSFAIESLAQESASAPRAFDGSCWKWFDIMGKLIQYGANVRATDLRRLMQLFTRYWHLSEGSEELLECAKPILTVYIKSGLDPTVPLSSSGGVSTSLAHFAFHHSQNNALGSMLIEEINVRKHGSALARFLLTSCDCEDCPCPNANLDEALRMLLEEIINAGASLDFDILIECLENSPEERIVESLRTIVDVMPYTRKLWDFNRRDKLVNAIASARLSICYELAEVIFAPIDHVDESDPIQSTMTSVEDSINAFAFAPSMVEAPIWSFMAFGDCGRAAKQRFVECVVHVGTKDAIMHLNANNAYVKEHLPRLIALRERYHLPDVTIPQRLLAAALGGRLMPERFGLVQAGPPKADKQSDGSGHDGWAYLAWH